MQVAKQYSHDTVVTAKEFINKKGRHLAYLLDRKKKAERLGYNQEKRELEEEITSLRNRINKAKLITFGF